jgi:hypothetical protein
MLKRRKLSTDAFEEEDCTRKLATAKNCGIESVWK